MTIPSALDTLIELAANQTDAAAKRLGHAIRACEDTKQKLELLLQYREDYAGRFQSNLTTGLNVAEYRNFQLFMDKLDAAITGQRKIVLDAQQCINDERNAWQACERKRMSYDTLATRAHKEELRQENRLDQKNTDELATRQAYYKR